MARQLFTWNADLGAKRSAKPAVQVNKFGDGYEQRTRLGINSKPEVWSVVFTRNRAEITPILEFLEDRGGYESFDWKTPLDQTKTFVCREWQFVQVEQGIFAISCDFVQVFEAA